MLVLHAPGTHRDREAAWACELAGGVARIARVDEVLAAPSLIEEAGLVIIPGGFSYGDDLGAGRILAARLAGLDALHRHVERGRLVLGICNGFQVLVKAGFLPGDDAGAPTEAPTVTLTTNAPAGFRCGWTELAVDPLSPCRFTRGLRRLAAPYAHGQGRLLVPDAVWDEVERYHLAPLRYADNPNGSRGDVAGLTNRTGTVLGLMPHPEDYLYAEQHPDRAREPRDDLGLALFRNALAACREGA